MKSIAKNRTVAGFNATTIMAMQYDSIIDEHRFATQQDRALNRIGDDHDALFPDAAELARRGFYVPAIAIGLHNGTVTVGDVMAYCRVVPEAMDVESANAVFIRMTPGRGRRALPITMQMVKAVGFDTNVVADCLESGAIDKKAFTTLVRSVVRGKTNVEHANSGLGNMYDAHASQTRRQAA